MLTASKSDSQLIPTLNKFSKNNFKNSLLFWSYKFKLTPSFWQEDWSFDACSVFSSQFLRVVLTSVTAAPKSILRGCELRYGPLVVHRLCLGCFESDSKKMLGPLVIDIFGNFRVKNRDYGSTESASRLFWI